ncbi:MAG: hypothetical protein JSS81_16500 [Acidobacteria bacterium]|nr:hypothetical protein [Acidobacteriota bacterium]
MARISRPTLFLLFAVEFCAGFYAGAKFFDLFWEFEKTVVIEKAPNPPGAALFFTGGKVYNRPLGQLDEIKRDSTDYTFLVPPNSEKYYNQQLARDDEYITFQFETEPAGDGRQRITLTGRNFDFCSRFVYEATDKKVYPKTYMRYTTRDYLYIFIAGLVGGGLLTVFVVGFYRNFIAL